MATSPPNVPLENLHKKKSSFFPKNEDHDKDLQCPNCEGCLKRGECHSPQKHHWYYVY